MDIRIQSLLSSNHAFQSMFSSTVGQIMTMMEMISGTQGEPRTADDREAVIKVLADVLAAAKPDTTSWAYVRENMHYDEYLRARTQAGTITDFDLIRPGLQEHNFSDLLPYFDHFQRVIERRKRLEEAGVTATKTCSRCRMDKPISAFKKGSVCNTCRSKAYRDRKAAVAPMESSFNTIREGVDSMLSDGGSRASEE